MTLLTPLQSVEHLSIFITFNQHALTSNYITNMHFPKMQIFHVFWKKFNSCKIFGKRSILEDAHWCCSSMSMSVHQNILDLSDALMSVIMCWKSIVKEFNMSAVRADLFWNVHMQLSSKSAKICLKILAADLTFEPKTSVAMKAKVSQQRFKRCFVRCSNYE